MSKINIHRGTFLEKEELTRMIGFLNEKPEVPQSSLPLFPSGWYLLEERLVQRSK